MRGGLHVQLKPFTSAEVRRPVWNKILRSVISRQDMEFRRLIEMASFICRKIVLATQIRRSGLTTFSMLSRFVRARSNREARGCLAETPTLMVNTREMLQRYYKLIQEIAAQEMLYVCEVLNVMNQDEGKQFLHFDDVMRTLR
jgi:hypothetical protein